MWRWAMLFAAVTGSTAAAGQVRSSFQVGLTITGRANTANSPARASAGAIFVPLPRPRPAVTATNGTPQGKSNLRFDGE
jgi:hypothetical protein